ncbi:MAG: 3-dehydroquinate synthase [Legionellales bacterium]|nr:3-dehydroquinate synthase [Legionellales bacterium]
MQLKVEKTNTKVYFTDIFTSSLLAQCCKKKFAKVIILTDENVSRLYKDKILSYFNIYNIQIHIIQIPAGEGSKTREVKMSIEDQMFQLGCGRDTLMLAFGGGVITDLAGFVAATFCRGVPAIYIPTTLLAMVDASLGGKTGVNTIFGKNTIGTFTEPQAVFMDMHFIFTLTDFDYWGAVAEIIKHALIHDINYFQKIEDNFDKLISKDLMYISDIIKKSCEIKASIVAEDYKEVGKREILNFGHTIAHALEFVSEYQLPHGIAVAYGMIAEAYIANKLDLLAGEAFERIQHIISLVLSQLNFKITFEHHKIIEALKYDKKNRDGSNRIVLLERIGSVYVDQNTYAHVVNITIIDDAIKYLFTFLSRFC